MRWVIETRPTERVGKEDQRRANVATSTCSCQPEGMPEGYTVTALTQLEEIFNWTHLP